jgi:cation diffusion facilitator family transporter
VHLRGTGNRILWRRSLDATRRKTSVARLSVISNSTLVAGKLLIGLAIGSVSVISEAIHSGFDLVASVIALLAVRAASRPPDRQHPYGHGKIENISGAIEATLIFGAAGWIIFEAVKKLMRHEGIENAGLGVAIMAVSALANYMVSGMLFKVAKETDSVALQADGWHLRTDVWTSLGVLAGLGIITLGGLIVPDANLWWIDPVAAIAVAMLIVKAALDLTRHSIRDVLDESLPEEEVARIEYEIRICAGVRGVHDLRTRKSGMHRFVDFHLLVDPHMPTVDSHHLTDELAERIESMFPGASISIHVEPFEAPFAPECETGGIASFPEQPGL